jgi:hypothetical protein
MKNTLKQRLFSLPIAALMLAAMPLGAQDSGWSKLNYGLQASVAFPQSDLGLYADTGYGLAWYIEKVWSNNWALRGRLEYVDFSEASGWDWNNNSYTIKLSQVGVMGDAIYYGLHDKFYLFGGLGFFSRSYSETTMHDQFDGDNELSVSLGVGWNFTPHWGVEIKKTFASYDWLQASVLYRF